MSVRRAQREVSSREFAEWMAVYVLEAEEQDPDRPPTPPELDAKMRAFGAGGRE